MTSAVLGIAGAGRMGSALLSGWAKARRDGFDRTVIVFEPQLGADASATLKALDAKLNPPPQGADVLDTLILAIKPQTFSSAAAGFAPFVGPNTLVISIMAGVTIAAIKMHLGAARVVRAMPNTPGAIGRGVTAYAQSPGLPPDDYAQVEALLAPLGAVERVANESAIDAVTAVSGSGPAYVFLLV
ncbi:MAG: NAD(P)-binding domain-containing protein, partial [Caulobacterales bacterium]